MSCRIAAARPRDDEQGRVDDDREKRATVPLVHLIAASTRTGWILTKEDPAAVSSINAHPSLGNQSPDTKGPAALPTWHLAPRIKQTRGKKGRIFCSARERYPPAGRDPARPRDHNSHIGSSSFSRSLRPLWMLPNAAGHNAASSSSALQKRDESER